MDGIITDKVKKHVRMMPTYLSRGSHKWHRVISASRLQFSFILMSGCLWSSSAPYYWFWHSPNLPGILYCVSAVCLVLCIALAFFLSFFFTTRMFLQSHYEWSISFPILTGHSYHRGSDNQFSCLHTCVCFLTWVSTVCKVAICTYVCLITALTPLHMQIFASLFNIPLKKGT